MEDDDCGKMEVWQCYIHINATAWHLAVSMTHAHPVVLTIEVIPQRCFFTLDCVGYWGIDKIITGENLLWSHAMRSSNSVIAVPSPKMPACNQR